MTSKCRCGLIACMLMVPASVEAQTVANLAALNGLAPISVLFATPEGRTALADNLRITREIQMGAATQPLLMQFREQQQQALRDAFITDGNATQLADGLGTKLAAAYQLKASYIDPATFSSVSASVANLFGYTNNITKADSNLGKFFFANETIGGKQPISDGAKAILNDVGGTTDIFGRAYDLQGGGPGANAFGNSRPFQTQPLILGFRGADYFGRSSQSFEWLVGPSQDLTNSPSFPSGHTTYGYTEAVLLAILVPNRYQQMITRAAEYGNDRIVMGAHYAMDVIGGRATALHAVAHLLANDPDYVGQVRSNPAVVAASSGADEVVVITNFTSALAKARSDLHAFFEAACGNQLAACASADNGRFANGAANKALYDATQTYSLPIVHHNTLGVEDVGKICPEAGHLLTAAFPSLSLTEANQILTATEGPGGGFLDDGSAFGVYSRIDLFAAAGRAEEVANGNRSGQTR